MTEKIHLARMIATVGHGATGQRRKHSGIAYINHPADVVRILTAHSTILSGRMIQAAWMHDLIEDTELDIDFIFQEFGVGVARMVFGLTNDKAFVGNREERHRNNVLRLSKTAPDVKSIKLADSIANMLDIIREDPAFATVYLAEKRELLDTALREGCPVLWAMADKIIVDYFAKSVDVV